MLGRGDGVYHKKARVACCSFTEFSLELCGYFARFDVFTTVRLIMALWVLAPCRPVGRCQRFGETYFFIFRAEDHYLEKRHYMYKMK
jgi:hypothetical protein